MIVPEENRLRKREETRDGLLFTLITIVSFCVGFAFVYWLGGIFHSEWGIALLFVGGFSLSSGVAIIVCKVFGVDFLEILSSEYRY